MNSTKAFYAVFAFFPIGVIAFSLVIFWGAADLMVNGDNGTDRVAAVGGLILGEFVIAVGAVLALIGMIFYIYHIARNKTIPQKHRIFWILGMVFAVGVANIVYFIAYIIDVENAIPEPDDEIQHDEEIQRDLDYYK